MSAGGLLGLVHTAVSWQEGIPRPVSKVSTSSLVIYMNMKKVEADSDQHVYIHFLTTG